MTGSLVRVPLDAPRWADLVRRTPGTSTFHDPAWARMLADCYRFDAFVLALELDCRLVAGIPVVDVDLALQPRRWVSLPFTDVCGVVATSPCHATSLVAALGRAATRNDPAIELRSATAVEDTDAGAAAWHVLPLLDDDATLFAGLHASHRRNVRLAGRNGVEIRRGEHRNDLVRTFYDLHVDTRRRLGSPVQPRRYFELLWERIVEPGLGHVAIATHGTDTIAAAVYLDGGDTTIYKYGASDAKAWPLHANHLLMWEAISAAAEAGKRSFDFGRCALSNDGLRTFKRHFGAVEHTIAYSTFGAEPRAAERAVPTPVQWSLQRGPRMATRLAGELVYRRGA